MTTCPKCARTYEDGVRFCPVDGAVVAPSSDPYLGKVLMGQFELNALAGRGAMGTVYKAEQTTMGRTVAVKILRRDLLKDAGVVKRFLREARAAARLSHPAIVTVHLVGETDEGVPYIVMEFVDGPSLGSLCEKEGQLTPRRAIHIAKQIASALGEAHAHGIVHRDLKPENILLVDKRRATDQVKVLDFGIAKILRDEAGEVSALTRDGTIFGTPHYISPEQAGGNDVDARADLYSLGVILFRMATGRLPFEGTSGMQVLLRHIKEAPPRARSVSPGLPDALDDLIFQLLQKDPADRPQDAENLIEGLDAAEAAIDDPASTILGMAPVKSAKAPRPPLPLVQVARAPTGQGEVARAIVGERELEAWAESPLPEDDPNATGEIPRRGDSTDRVARGLEDGGERRPSHRRRNRALLWTSVAAVAVGGGAGLLYAMHGGQPQVVAPPPPAVPPVVMVKAPEAPPHPAESPVALAEERVVVGGPFAMRLGFEHAPVQGERSALRVSIEDAGGSLSDAKVEVGLRAGSGREELLSVRRDGNVYLADADFRSAGRHHLRVAAGPRGAESPLKSAFDFEVAAAVGAQAGREPPKRHERAGRDEDDKPIPTVVIEAPHNAPQKPRALGPSPAATGLNPLPIAQPPIVPLPASPPPSRVVPVPVAPSPAPITPSSGGEEEEDPYKVLDNKR